MTIENFIFIESVVAQKYDMVTKQKIIGSLNLG